MKRTRFSILVVLALILTVFTGLLGGQASGKAVFPVDNRTLFLPGEAEPPIDIPDNAFRAAICELLGRPVGDVYPSEVAGITTSNYTFAGRGITDIKGIEYFTGLEEVRFCYNDLTDISLLAGLANLRLVWITFNQVSSIDALSGLPGLCDLRLTDNKISDITPLVNNPGIGAGDNVTIDANWLDLTGGSADMSGIVALEGRGVSLVYSPQKQFTLATSVTGQGAISLDPDLPAYYYGSVVGLSAVAAPGWSFTGWSGDVTGADNPADIYINGNKTVAAAFTEDSPPPPENYNLTLVAEHGTVTKDPDLPLYPSGTAVQLQAEAAPGWQFSGWSGDLGGADNPAGITMDSDKVITANFAQIVPVSQNYTLDVFVNGRGNVHRLPWEPEFPAGTEVQLTAVPRPGWVFSAWSGNLTGPNPNKIILMDQDHTITATFTQQYCVLYATVHNNTGGIINVFPAKAGMIYDIGEPVTLTAVPYPGWLFAGWTGFKDGPEDSVAFTMDDDRYITAHFVRIVEDTPGIWWEEEGTFSRRIPLTITETSGKNLVDYQVKITVPYCPGMQADYDDVRFLDKDNATLLDCWKQRWTENEACFWVKVPYIPASGTAMIYMYFGNSAAVSVSDIHQTFIFGDDFENHDWTKENLHAVNFGDSSQWPENGVYHMTGSALSEPLAEPYEMGAMKPFPPDYVAEIDFSPVNLIGGAFLAPRYNETDDKYECWVNVQWNYIALSLKDGGAWRQPAFELLGWTVAAGDWYALKTSIVMGENTNLIKIYLNENLYINTQDASLQYPWLSFLTYGWNDAFHMLYDNFRVREYAASEPVYAYGAEQEGCKVSTCEAENVTKTSADLCGFVFSMGLCESLTVSFDWGLTPELGNTTGTLVVSAAGKFNITLHGLSAGTTYYFRAKAAGCGTLKYGGIMPFTTIAEPHYTLTVNVNGQGTVVKDPDLPSYLSGTAVQLQAESAPGWQFSGWSGDLDGAANPAGIVMDSDKTITATFIEDLPLPPKYTLTIISDEHGTVIRDPDLPSYEAGTTVRLTAVPVAGWSFNGWSGGLSGTQNPCNIVMDADKSVTAAFKKNASPSPGGGGGGGASAANNRIATNLRKSISANGTLAEDVDAESIDSIVMFSLKRGTVCRNRIGALLPSIIIEKNPDTIGNIPRAGLLGAVYSFAPEGANFRPGAMLTFRYSPASLPAGIKEENLKIVWWDQNEGRWVELESIVDTAKRTVLATIEHFSYYSLVLHVSPAAFEIDRLTLSSGEAGKAEEITVEASVVNTGDASGSYNLILSVNGQVQEEKEVTLLGGEAAVVTFTCCFYQSGSYDIDVNGVKQTLKVLPSAAIFNLENLKIAPEKAEAGEDITVSFEVVNSGEIAGEFDVVCLLNDLSYENRKVNVAGGSREAVNIVLTSLTAGMHRLVINEELAGEFEVIALPAAVPEPVVTAETVPAESTAAETDTGGSGRGTIVLIVVFVLLAASVIVTLVLVRAIKK